MATQEERRDVLAKLLRAVVTGVALSTPVVANALVVGGDIARYVKLVQFQQEAIKINKLKRAETDRELKQHIEVRLNKKMDQLLNFSMDHFTAENYNSPEAMVACRELFTGKFAAIDTMSVEGLQQLADVIVPVAVARHLLARERICFDTRKVKSWDRFADRYRDLIMGA